jgi:hypothetical protein
LAQTTATAPVDPSEIKAALDTILRSDTFARSERSRELLRYLVEKELAGESDRLKGFSIAMDVFGREDNFDPSTDAVVRVQARRLRDMLDAYYRDEGFASTVRISIPRGSYVPAYGRIERPDASDEGAGPGSRRVLTSLDFGGPSEPGFALETSGEGGGGGYNPEIPVDGGNYSKFVVRNIRRFWLALAVIVVLLGVILSLLVISSLKGVAASDRVEGDKGEPFVQLAVSMEIPVPAQRLHA